MVTIIIYYCIAIMFIIAIIFFICTIYFFDKILLLIPFRYIFACNLTYNFSSKTYNFFTYYTLLHLFLIQICGSAFMSYNTKSIKLRYSPLAKIKNISWCLALTSDRNFGIMFPLNSNPFLPNVPFWSHWKH